MQACGTRGIGVWVRGMRHWRAGPWCAALACGQEPGGVAEPADLDGWGESDGADGLGG